MSPVATPTTTPSKPAGIKTIEQSVNPAAEHPSIENYAQTLQVASAGAGLSVNPTNLGVDSDGGLTTSPTLGCATKSCAVCGGCGQKLDLVNIVSGRQHIKQVNEAELKQNETAILYAPPSNPNLIDYVKSAKDGFEAKLINPPPPDQPVSQGQGQNAASPNRSPVPPSIQTDPAAIPTPQTDPIGSKIPPAKSVDAVSPTPPPDVTALANLTRKPEDIVPASSKCPFKNLVLAGQQAMEDLAQRIRRSVEDLKHQFSTAVIGFSSQIGLTINQEKLTRELQLINDRSINNQNDKLGATQGASYFSNGKRPEAQDGPQSIKIQDPVAAIPVNHTTDPAKTVSDKGGPPTVTYGEVAANARSSNTASQVFSRSSTSGRLNQVVAGFLSTSGQSINRIKAAVSTGKLAANPSSAPAKQYPQIVNGLAKSQNISSKAALAGSAYSSPRMGLKTSTSSPANRIPSNSAAMQTNPVILSRASASVSASINNQIVQAPSPTSAKANLSKTANPRASNYNLSLRRGQLNIRTTSFITLSQRRAAVGRNLENLALKLPSSLANRLAEVTTNLRFALSRNSASTTFSNSSRRFAINASQANQLVRKLQQAIAQSLMRATRGPFKLFRTVKFNPNGQVLTATRLKPNTSVSEALARVASKIKSTIEPKRIDAAELIQKLNRIVLHLRQKILAAFKPLTSTLALSRSRKVISREVQVGLSRKVTQNLSRLRFLVAQLTSLKARQASFQLQQASLRFRILASILTRNLNNSTRSLRASARSLIIQAKLNLASSTAQSLRRSLLARFFSLQRRLLAAKVNTARAIRFVSQRLSSEAALRAGLLQRKITLPSLRLSARTKKFAKLKLSQSWHKLLERVKLAGKTSQVKVSHFRKMLGTPQKVLNSLSSNAQPGSWQKLMRRKDLIVRFNSVAQRFLPLLLRAVNLITRSSYQHPFWFLLLELVKRRDKKKDWFKNNKVFLAQFLYIFSLILKQLNKAGRGVESLSPQELFALVRKALRKTFSQSAQQPQVVSANQAKGSKSIFAVNKSATPDKNLSIFKAKI
jgi:hypothetical protein